jgi:hypothetical protein
MMAAVNGSGPGDGYYNKSGNWSGRMLGRNGSMMGPRGAMMSNLSKEFREERKDLREERMGDIKRLRNISKDMIADAIARLKDDRDKLKQLHDEEQTQRQALLDAKVSFNATCGKNNATNATDDCKRAREQVKEKSGEFLGNSVEQMLRIIGKTKTRVMTDPHISNATSVTIVAQLDAEADMITADQATISGLINTSNSSNATKAAVQKLRQDWEQARVTIRLSEGLLNHVRFAEFLDKLDIMSHRLHEASAELKSEGKDTTQLDSDLAKFDSQINASATAYAGTRDSYVSAMVNAKTEADANQLIKTTRDQLNAANDDLKQARDDLKQVVNDIRVLNGAKLAEVAKKVNADVKENATTVNDGDDGGDDA